MEFFQVQNSLSVQVLYSSIGSITTWHIEQWASAKLCSMVQGMELWNFRSSSFLTEGATYILRVVMTLGVGHILVLYCIVYIHCVSKNVTPLTSYNLYIHGSIATIFGKNTAKKVGNQNTLYFPASLN